MKRLAFVSVAGLIALGLSPALAQERPNPNPRGGGGEHAVARPSGGGGGSNSGSSASSPSSSSPSSPSGGGSAVGVDRSSSGRGSDRAVPRSGRARSGGGSRGGGEATARPGGGSPKSVIIPANPQRRDPGDDRNGPNTSYARPRAGRPPTGTAVPRDISNTPDLPWRRDPYWAYGYYQYSRWMPFYYGPWGGYMYYDPFWWDYYYGYYPGYYGGHYGGGYAQTYSESDYDTGKLKLKVRPREAQVYVDGYFTGVVDDYDGVLQRLRLRAGTHRVELRLEGYEPSVFDVLIVEGETVTYRAQLQRKP